MILLRHTTKVIEALASTRKILCVCLAFFFSLYAQCQVKAKEKEQDLELATKLKAKYGPKIPVVCLNSSSVITFDNLGVKRTKNQVTATIETKEKFLSLRDEYVFVNAFGCDDDVDVSDIKGFDYKNRPLYTPVVDVSNENGNDFYSDERSRYVAIHFSFLGEKVTFDEQTIVNDLKYLTEIPFVNDYPIISDTIKFIVPDWLNIEFKETNFDTGKIKKVVKTDLIKHRTTYTYIASNMPPAYFDENDAPATAFMFPHILPMCKSYKDDKGQTVNIISSVDDLYQWNEGLVKKAGNDDGPLRPLVNELIKGKLTDEDKIKAIYYWVEDNIRYVAFENGILGFKPTPCQTVLQNKYGDCKCKANLLSEMLKIAGYNAGMVWIGVKEIPYDLSTPSIADFNHCITTLMLNGTRYYLDATMEFASFGDNSDFIQGREVLFENGNTFGTDHVPVAPIERNRIAINKTLSVKNDLLTGDAHYLYNGDSKTDILYEYNEIPSDEREKKMKFFITHHNTDITLLQYQTSNLKDRDIPISLDYNFSEKNQVTQFDNDLYVGIDNDKEFGGIMPILKIQFDSNRHCDFEFPFKVNDDITDTLLLPSNYTVKHVPGEVSIITPNYSFVINVSQFTDKIVYHKKIKVFNKVILKKDFNSWNLAIDQLKSAMDDQVILTKQ